MCGGGLGDRGEGGWAYSYVTWLVRLYFLKKKFGFWGRAMTLSGREGGQQKATEICPPGSLGAFRFSKGARVSRGDATP